MIFRQLFDYESWTYTYLLADESTREAILIDTVKEQVDRDLTLLAELNLKLKFIVDTHVHADHITGAWDLKARTGAKNAISAVAKLSCADIQLHDGDELSFGKYRLRALATPGHTNTCMSFFLDGYVFTGDVLMIRDVGRTDFQEGSNERMYASIQKLFALPDDTKMYPGHDYKGRMQSTIAEEKALNSKAGGGKDFAAFERLMKEMKLGQPKKIHIAVPANLECGRTQ
jgi:sulfur dioxygenase